MKLENLGYNSFFEKFRSEQGLDSYAIGRVIAEHKERYVVLAEEGEFTGEITGNMRYNAESREDFPAVGDWVAMTVYDSDMAVIHQIFPRFSVVKRQAVGQFGEVQIIASNIDYAFIVQAIDRDFNPNRLERYLTICYSADVSPVIVLTKTDLINEHEISAVLDIIKQRIKDVPVIPVSSVTKKGYDELNTQIEKGRTYCMLGSSGVGKSTILNNLAGKDIMKTDAISASTSKGKHVTSHRELFVLENGGILIDNPGMREVGIADSSGGLEVAFDMIYTLSEKCRYRDCTHISETGCAVIEAVENGSLDKDFYKNYLKMLREKEHFETSAADKRRKEKIFGKILKDYNKKNIKRR